MKNLICTGGIFHDFGEMSTALSEVLSEAGVESLISNDIDECAEKLNAGGIDLFTVYALRWRMLDGDKYEPYRKEWALDIAPATCQAIERHVSQGGGLLALHTAAICFDNWAEWPEIIGGGWIWGQSWHPPLQAAEVFIADREHALSASLSDFSVQDEVYQAMALRDDIQVLANARTANETQVHPVIWTHRYGQGRVLCDTLGHDGACIRQPQHAEMLRRGARWAAGK